MVDKKAIVESKIVSLLAVSHRFLSRNISVKEYLLGTDENLTRDGDYVSPKRGRRQDLRKGEAKAADENLVGADNKVLTWSGRRQSDRRESGRSW